MIFHVVDFAVVSSCFEYKTDAERLSRIKNKMLDFLHFRMRVAEGLMKVGKATTKKLDLPSGEDALPNMKITRGKCGCHQKWLMI